jgi:hypothetical protein
MIKKISEDGYGGGYFKYYEYDLTIDNLFVIKHFQTYNLLKPHVKNNIKELSNQLSIQLN